MTKVFIGGSRTLTRLNSQVRDHIDSITAQHFPIVVGDANGADKAVQSYLNLKGYRYVEIFCSGGRPRNNIGSWKIRSINSENSKDRRERYTVKDRAMASEAEHGFMLWDGESLGTLLNVYRLAAAGKKSVVYLAPSRRFTEVVSLEDWKRLAGTLQDGQAEKLNELLKKEPAESSKQDLGRNDAQLRLAF